jgi:hypothetical protein
MRGHYAAGSATRKLFVRCTAFNEVPRRRPGYFEGPISGPVRFPLEERVKAATMGGSE